MVLLIGLIIALIKRDVYRSHGYLLKGRFKVATLGRLDALRNPKFYGPHKISYELPYNISFYGLCMVTAKRSDVTRRVFRPRAQLFAEEDILDIVRLHCLLEQLTVELRIPAAIRHRTHVAQRGYLVQFEKGDKIIDRSACIADCLLR